MELRGRRAVITGGAGGIGRGLAEAFVAAGAAEVVIADLDAERVAAVSAEIGAVPATSTSAPRPRWRGSWPTWSAAARSTCSAPTPASTGGRRARVADADWDLIWRINVMAHVWAARALLPAMLARGEGYLLNTASAAGLLTNLGLLPYSVTKHAAVGVAEWLAITYGAPASASPACARRASTRRWPREKGEPRLERAMAAAGDLLCPGGRGRVVEGIGRREFLILPHPEVRDHATRRAAENERWMRGMRRLWSST